MKNTHIFILAAAVCLTACAKAVESGPNDANKPYFESWIKINHPNAKRTPMGVYVVSETPGKGDLVGAPQDDQYLRM